MIVDFSFKNFRSFRHESMLSMHAEHPKNNLLKNIAYPLGDGLAILKSAVIYGANASGKSNVLLALHALKYIVGESHAFKENRKINCYEPFLLSSDSKNLPIEMELEFVIKGNRRYFYHISFDSDQIVSESLDFYPGRVKANIFSKKPGDTWETISFGAHYKGGSKRIPFFKNNSYLSKAGNSAASPKFIREVYEYFTDILIMGISYEMPVAEIYSHDEVLEMTANLLKKVDVGISGITKEENDLSAFPGFPNEIPKHAVDQFLSAHKYNFLFHHKDDAGADVTFDKNDESEGTQKLFTMMPAVFSALKVGNILVMDELENSFHPHVAELIIKLFNDPEVNVNNAQLIFTTHNIELMSPRLFRRDQIWFTKKTDGASRIFSLDEFDKTTVTSSSPFGDWYSDGRFGAIPSINYKEISSFIVDALYLREDKARRNSGALGGEE